MRCSYLQGDSGGPLVRTRKDKRYQIDGIISFGVGCAMKGKPLGGYTRVSYYLPWIKATVDRMKEHSVGCVTKHVDNGNRTIDREVNYIYTYNRNRWIAKYCLVIFCSLQYLKRRHNLAKYAQDTKGEEDDDDEDYFDDIHEEIVCQF